MNKIIKKAKKRFVTLIEIMIVMFLIALITGVVAYNYRGALDEGKAFKTRAGIEKLQTILSLVLADHPEADLGSQWKEYVAESPLVQNPASLVKDGWGEEYRVEFDQHSGGLIIQSKKYDDYLQAHKGSQFRK